MNHVSLSKGKLPFRYLGVPLNSRSLTVVDCEKLVDKMTSKIRGWQGKSLSYAARLQSVNSVLMRITTSWCQIFILPKKVIKVVNMVCRAFLWHYDSNDPKPRNVNWESLCWPKKEGGVGIRRLKL